MFIAIRRASLWVALHRQCAHLARLSQVSLANLPNPNLLMRTRVLRFVRGG